VVLAAAEVARLQRLQLSTTRRLVGHLSGEHRSPRGGTSLDFAGHRPYAPGDDLRRVDWAALARLDAPLVRLFDAEEDLDVRLLVDTSASMGLGGKLQQAVRVAAALGVVAMARRDAAWLHTTGGIGPRRFRGSAGVPALLDALGAMAAAGPTRLAAAALDLAARPGPPGVTILISDLLDPTWEEAVRRLAARGGDGVVAHVLADLDLRPDLDGDLELVDAETGRRVPVSLTSSVRAAYEQRAEAWLVEVTAACRSAGLGHLLVPAERDLLPLLLGAWREAGTLR
jgi:uncharacterized protein (DUF58 family)